MKIYYDSMIFSLQKAGGISIYFYEILKRMSKREYIYLSLNKENNIFFKILDLEKNTLKLNKKIPLFILRYLNEKIQTREEAIFHSSYYRTSNSKNIKNVTTVHDFTYEKYSKGLKKIIHYWQKKNAILNSDGIICVSENTKKDLLHYIPKAINKNIKVIYNGVGEEFKPLKIENNNQNIEKNILFVGDRSNYKNFDIVIEILKKRLDLNLTIVGGKEFSKDELEKMKTLENRYKRIKGISSEELNYVYNSSFALIYPSSYEGFGIPIIEAMRAGCPVISTKLSSIPEVAGDAALLVSEIDVEFFLRELKKLDNKEFRDEIIKLGLKQSLKFSWQKMFEETNDFYKKVLENTKI